MRLDSDTSTRKGSHAEILSAFERADAGVLLGTQMVAKGHDFPDVVLSLLIDADAGLRFPDLRAEERTFALVAQLAGRSGRGIAGGRVMVQTLAPEADAIAFAAETRRAGLPRGRAAASQGAALPAVREPDQDRDLGAAGAARPTRPRHSSRPGCARCCRPKPACSARRRAFACAAASVGSCWSRHRCARPRSTPSAEPCEGAASARALRGVQLSVDVDPQ